MAIIVVSRFLVSFFSCVIAWCGLTWHIGFTVQNRFTWGLRGAYIPLIQRSLLNFVWSAVQAWNGGKLIAYADSGEGHHFRLYMLTLPQSHPYGIMAFLPSPAQHTARQHAYHNL